MTLQTREFNFDGIVGPTHNYAGLAQGNIASQEHRRLVSHPRQAALQGLEKMKLLADLGVPQAVLPPQDRPDVVALRRLGFSGTDSDVLTQAARESPELLAACSSASAMWAANAATVSPSADTHDGLLHITPANLCGHLHRALETPFAAQVLGAIFPGPLFAHHDSLASTPELADEGAANHSRLCIDHDGSGAEFFVYGRDSKTRDVATARFAPRQSLHASQAIARLHQLDPRRTIFVQQHPDAIDAGVFHNDVIAVAHRNLLLYHERAYVDAPHAIGALRRAFGEATDAELHAVCIPDSLLPLADAVRSYFFNSQIVSLPNGAMALVTPQECESMPAAARAVEFVRTQVPALSAVHFVDVRQSMRNGGGPAE